MNENERTYCEPDCDEIGCNLCLADAMERYDEADCCCVTCECPCEECVCDKCECDHGTHNKDFNPTSR